MNWHCRICSWNLKRQSWGQDVDLWLMSNVLYFQNDTTVFSSLIKKRSSCIRKIVASCVCQLYSVGNEALNHPNVGVRWFRKHKGWPEHSRGGRWIVKSRFARGKLDMWQSLLVLRPSPQFHPINYSISPNNHCVNHNYTEPALLLTMKTPAAPSL